MTTVPGLQERIGEREARLRERWDVTGCRVTAEDRPPRAFERKRFNVRLELSFAGHDLVINREDDDDPGRALDAAFAAAQRRLGALERMLHER
ncbi:MAG TPA: HPF/RaiA family ribosome-associated protein [Burkholderiales bacterium]